MLIFSAFAQALYTNLAAPAVREWLEVLEHGALQTQVATFCSIPKFCAQFATFIQAASHHSLKEVFSASSVFSSPSLFERSSDTAAYRGSHSSAYATLFQRWRKLQALRGLSLSS